MSETQRWTYFGQDRQYKENTQNINVRRLCWKIGFEVKTIIKVLNF